MFERAITAWRAMGPYAIYFWGFLVLNGAMPLLYFSKRIRNSLPALFVISLLVNVGIYLDHYIVIVTATAHDFLPHVWFLYAPTWVEIVISLGAGCLFFGLYMAIVRVIPPVSIVEARPEPELKEAGA